MTHLSENYFQPIVDNNMRMKKTEREREREREKAVQATSRCGNTAATFRGGVRVGDNAADAEIHREDDILTA